jgi:hypothetical protein
MATAVYRCRCAFLWFFLLHKQKKEHKEKGIKKYEKLVYVNDVLQQF